MVKGDLKTKLKWECAFGHQFEASPTLVLLGGHWCPECMPTPWNYDEEARHNPFFAQVWKPLHDIDAAIGDSVKLCLDAIDGKVKLIEMKAE